MLAKPLSASRNTAQDSRRGDSEKVKKTGESRIKDRHRRQPAKVSSRRMLRM